MTSIQEALASLKQEIAWDDLESIPVASLPPSLGCLTLKDVSRRELDGFKQRSDELFIPSSPLAGKIAEIVDRPLQRGDSILRVIKGLIRDPRGKFRPN
ncbi:hypothetical protein CK203_099173 [Vitis vinifera]|uniref:Uncharacterized protein n=1 Tax=Vitis vinifera TaxID=29760 RepID=A0A438BT56_VITVI|nr:hypothetical protein CK203_099173 [Vitis vinifera]